jgi:thioredoxin 2
MSNSIHVVCANCRSKNRVAKERITEGARCWSCKRPLFSGHPFALTGESFDRHLQADDLPLVVDFWAGWCGPCRMMAPAYDEAAARLEPRVRLAKLDTDAEPEVAGRYGIRGIPTMIAFKNGREVARQSGALDAGRIVAWVEANT